jgi:hypothetical protein
MALYALNLYSLYNTTLSFYFFVYSMTCFGRIGPSSGVFLPKLFHRNLYIKYINVLSDVRPCIICLVRSSYIVLAQVHLLTFKTFKIYVTFIKFLKTLFLLKRSYTNILGYYPLVQSM